MDSAWYLLPGMYGLCVIHSTSYSLEYALSMTLPGEHSICHCLWVCTTISRFKLSVWYSFSLLSTWHFLGINATSHSLWCTQNMALPLGINARLWYSLFSTWYSLAVVIQSTWRSPWMYIHAHSTLYSVMVHTHSSTLLLNIYTPLDTPFGYKHSTWYSCRGHAVGQELPGNTNIHEHSTWYSLRVCS